MVDLKDLRAKAEAATPGEWWRLTGGSCTVRAGERKKDYCPPPLCDAMAASDAAFIAAANPATVLELLDEVELLRETVRMVSRDGHLTIAAYCYHRHPDLFTEDDDG